MQTQLKYAVEIVIPRSTRMLGVLEPLLERTVFEDVPTNLAAVKQRVESMQVGLHFACASQRHDLVEAEDLGSHHFRPHAMFSPPFRFNSRAYNATRTLQAELTISELENAGEVVAAASLRRKLERPSLSGKPSSFAQ